jgi:hypothetical protein
MSEPNDGGLPSSEDLDAVAEEQAIADATVTKINDSVASSIDSAKLCSYCHINTAQRICSHCGQEFCSQHYCPVHEMSTQVEPLTEEDGTVHQGRRIRLIGEGWPNDLRLVKDYTDEELEFQISGLQRLLQDAIKTADYARISIAAREYERDYRKHSRYVAAMKRREKLTQGAVRLNSKKHRMDASAKPLTMAETLAKQMNLTVEQATALLGVLGAQKKA